MQIFSWFAKWMAGSLNHVNFSLAGWILIVKCHHFWMNDKMSFDLSSETKSKRNFNFINLTSYMTSFFNRDDHFAILMILSRIFLWFMVQKCRLFVNSGKESWVAVLLSYVCLKIVQNDKCLINSFIFHHLRQQNVCHTVVRVNHGCILSIADISIYRYLISSINWASMR